MKHTIKQLDLSTYKNVYICGDIHGCYTVLMQKLKEIGFNTNTDLLICTGDLVDRGPEPLQCIQLLSCHWFKSIRGNHEEFCIQGFYNDVYRYSHLQPNNGGSWFYELDETTQLNIVTRFKSLPLGFEFTWEGKEYGVLHADIPVDDWELLKDMLVEKASIKGRELSDFCLWARETVNMPTRHIKNRDQIFFGHTVLPEVTHIGNCTFLDTGAVFGHLFNTTEHFLTVIKLGEDNG